MKKLAIFLSSLIIICFCSCQNKIINPNNKSKSVNKIDNIAFPIHVDIKDDSYRDIVEDSSYIYYCNKEGINKTYKKNGKHELIYKQDKIGNLVLAKDCIYFVKNCTPQKIFKIKKNGQDCTQVFDEQKVYDYDNVEYSLDKDVGNITNFNVINNKIYILFNISPIYCYDLKSKELKLMVRDVSEFEIVNQDIYYRDYGERTWTIYKKNLNDMKTQIVLGKGISEPKDNLYSEFEFIGDKMYYATRVPNGVYCYSDGKNINISNSTNEYINKLLQYNGFLYYVAMDEKNLYKLMKYDAKSNSVFQTAELKDYNGLGLRIVNGYAYFTNTKNKTESIQIK